MADETERQATPFMSCFDLKGAESSDKSTLLAGIKGNEKAGGDKDFKKIAAGHGPQILGTLYSLNFETALRAQAFLRCAEMKLSPEDFVEFLEELAQSDDIKSLVKMVVEKRTDYTGKSLVNPALAGDVATTGEAVPGRWAAWRDPTNSLKQQREELIAQQKKETAWAKQDKAFQQQKDAGLMTDEEIETKKDMFFAQDPANDTFDGNLEDSGEETEKTGTEKIKDAGANVVADGIAKGFGNLFGS